MDFGSARSNHSRGRGLSFAKLHHLPPATCSHSSVSRSLTLMACDILGGQCHHGMDCLICEPLSVHCELNFAALLPRRPLSCTNEVIDRTRRYVGRSRCLTLRARRSRRLGSESKFELAVTGNWPTAAHPQLMRRTLRHYGDHTPT